MSKSSLLFAIEEHVNKYKLHNIVTLHTKNKHSLFDYFLVATGNSSNHIRYVATNISYFIKNRYNKISYVEGIQVSDWIVIIVDYISINLFIDSARSKYDIENLWKSINDK